MNKLLATTTAIVFTPMLFLIVESAFLPDNPSERGLELAGWALLVLTVALWVVGPLGAWQRWWPSALAFALCGGSLALLLMMMFYAFAVSTD